MDCDLLTGDETHFAISDIDFSLLWSGSIQGIYVALFFRAGI